MPRKELLRTTDRREVPLEMRKTFIRLHFGEGISYSQIAVRTGVSRSTIANICTRAKARASNQADVYDLEAAAVTVPRSGRPLKKNVQERRQDEEMSGTQDADNDSNIVHQLLRAATGVNGERSYETDAQFQGQTPIELQPGRTYKYRKSEPNRAPARLMPPNPENPEILIFGAGAIGAFYGSRLGVDNNKNVNVSAVCRSNFDYVYYNGFSISSPTYGYTKWWPTRVFPSPGEAVKSGVKWDYIVVTTKALPDISDDSALLEGLVHDDTAIVLIQNGLGVEEPYVKRFPKAVVLSAVTVCSAAQSKPGIIQHNKWTRINSGPYPIGTEEAVKKNDIFNELLVKGGIKDASAYSAEKMQQLRWHKIAINAAMNPSSVLSWGTDNSTMSHDEHGFSHLKAVMEEVLYAGMKVVGRESYPKDFATPDQILESTKRNTSGSVPSMQLDWESSKPMELEVILGNPIRQARQKGIAVPRLETMYYLMKMAQKQRDRKAKAAATNGQPSEGQQPGNAKL